MKRRRPHDAAVQRRLTAGAVGPVEATAAVAAVERSAGMRERHPGAAVPTRVWN